MTIQEAYIQGLNDAESKVILEFKKMLRNEESEGFMNPDLESIRQIVKDRSDYYHHLASRNNNIGKTFRKKIKTQNESLDLLG